jgi:hypothetical protein
MTAAARGPVMLGVEGLELTPTDRERLAHPLCGGVILFARNFAEPDQLVSLTTDIHAAREPRLPIAVDHEGGRVQRFRAGFTAIPPMRTLGESWEHDVPRATREAEALGATIAEELRAHGVDFSFAPVLDLDWGSSTVIGDRAFSGNANAVAHLASALCQGLRSTAWARSASISPATATSRPTRTTRSRRRAADERDRRARPRAVRGARARRARGHHARARRLSGRDDRPAGLLARVAAGHPARPAGLRRLVFSTTSTWPARTAPATCSRARTPRSTQAATSCCCATTSPAWTSCCRAGRLHRSRTSRGVAEDRGTG